MRRIEVAARERTNLRIWAIERLQAQFDNLRFDNGPHSETRVVLRWRLLNAAKTGDVVVALSNGRFDGLVSRLAAGLG